MATPDTTALNAYAGAYEQSLFSTLRNGADIINDLTVIPSIKNTLKLTKLSIGDGSCAYREAFDSADDDLSYSGRDLTVELLKRDILVNPLKYRNTWMSQVMREGVNLDDLPFAAFVAEQTALKIAQELNDQAYLAKKGDGSTLAKSFDGLGTIIASAIESESKVASSGLVPIATGEITSSNAVSKFELMMKAMPAAYRRAGFNLYCSYDLFDKYNDDYRERFKKNYESNEKGVYFIDNTAKKVQLVPASWMGSSQRIIATPKENLLVGVDGLGDIDHIHTDVELELLKWRWLFAIGFQIRDLEAIKVNDRA